MGSIMGVFALISYKTNYRMVLSNSLESLYLVDNNEMMTKKEKIKKRKSIEK